MFTGIVEEIGKLLSIKSDSMTFQAENIVTRLEVGGSIAVNGVCLTATCLGDNTFTVDIMPETRHKSNMGGLSIGEQVNLETPLTMSKPIGGHFVQGHIDNTGMIKQIVNANGARLITITAPEDVLPYIVNKGFICIDGISLTVTEMAGSTFSVSIVGHTLNNTTLGIRKVQDMVNLEVDIIAKYIKKLTTKKNTKIPLSSF